MKTNLILKTGKSALIASALLVSGAGTALADGAGTTYAFGGYVKFDAMFSDYSGATPDNQALIRQWYLPSQIPVGDVSTDVTADFQARESRLFFKADTVTEGGDKIGGYVEIDFWTHTDGNEVVSNSFSPRIRHAFLKYNNWLFGQTWSTFVDISVLPENLDFLGPAESTTFIRQAQVRYTMGAWEFAAENPNTYYQTAVDTGGATGGRVIGNDSTMPDLAARYTFKLSNGGYIKGAGLYRQLKIDSSGLSTNESAYALSLSGKHFFGKDDIRWMATYGSGAGRYLGVAFGADAVLDGNGDLNAIDSMAAFVSYRHLWSGQWRSNFTVGAIQIDNDAALTGPTSNKSAESVHVNLIYNPLPKLDIGAEIIYATRTLENDADGDMTRVMFSAKYAF